MSNGKEAETGAEGSDSAATLRKQPDAHDHMFDSGIFPCANCGDSGEAQDMYNLPCNPRKTSRARLAKLIRCERCATEIAKRNQRHVGEPGCGVYYLRVTIPLLRPESEVAAEEDKPKKPSAQEIQEQRDRETLNWVLEGQRRREEAAQQARLKREREIRLDVVREYAAKFAEAAFDEMVGLPLPAARTEGDAHLCGLPAAIPCCQRAEVVRRYLVFRGELIGICDEASRTFLEVRGGHEDDPRYNKLLWFGERERAEQAAEKWNRAADAAENENRGQRKGSR